MIPPILLKAPSKHRTRAWEETGAGYTKRDKKVTNTCFNRVLLIPVLLGALPFNAELRATPLVTRFSLTIYLLLVASTVASIVLLDADYYSTPLEMYLDVAESLIVTSMPLSVYACSARGRRWLASIANSLEEGEEIQVGRGLWENLSAMVLLAWVTWLYFRVLPSSTIGDFLYIPALTLPYLYVSLSWAPFHVLARWMGAQFSGLVKGLGPAAFCQTRIEELADRHAALCRSAFRLNRIFSVPVLLVTLGTFNVAIINALALVKHAIGFSKTGRLNNSELDLTLALWTVMWLLEEGRIVASCVSVVSRSKEFNSALYELMMEDKTNQLAKNEKVQLHIAMKREAYFSACGLFPIDYTLIYSMLAGATTYLVILVQFDQMNN